MKGLWVSWVKPVPSAFMMEISLFPLPSSPENVIVPLRPAPGTLLKSGPPTADLTGAAGSPHAPKKSPTARVDSRRKMEIRVGTVASS